MRSWKFLLPLLASTLCFGAQPDRIAGPIDSSQVVAVKGNVHGLAQPRFDLGRTDGSKMIHGVTLAFRPSAAQQKDLNNLLAQQQDRSSPNYHKWLTPAQFADRFGMTQGDIDRVAAWLESQGFTVASVANSRNQISFDGTVAQVESVFGTEIHNYLVDSEIHFANATNPSVPAALAESVLAIGHLHDFNPKPRANFRRTSSGAPDPHFTSHVSGNHYLAPGDFATIYDVQALDTAGIDGAGQKIALTGQSSINLADVANFRSAAGLPANVPTLLLMPGTGTSTRCPGDEGESDLDVEWSGGVAKNASITLVYAGLVSGDTCGGNRQFGAFDALQYAIDQNVAPVISNSYGNCESAVGLSFAQTMQGWIRQANAQGQTVVSSSGDSGAADCDFQVTVATQGIAVDIPAAIPEVTGMGGTEFSADNPNNTTVVTNGNAAADPPYWNGTTGGTDTISSALSYIPEMGWNDTTTGGEILASGGGASTFFSKPSWQTGAGVPNDGKRDVPDLALNASPIHDPYLFCSEDGQNGAIVATCTSGFRDSGGFLAAVGGTSAGAPTFAATVALLNQYLGASGLGNVNPSLYALAASSPTAFNDVTTGNNIVPCTSGTPNCPAIAPFQFGFSAGVGYDQVTGLGSVNANTLFTAWPASRTNSSVTISPSATTINAGASVAFKVTVTPSTGVGTVSLSTLNNGVTTVLGTATLNIPYPPSSSGTATFTTTSLPGGSNSVTATYEGDAADKGSTSSPAIVTVSDFTLTTTRALTPGSIPAGQSASATLTISPVNGSTQTVNFTNSTSSSPGSCTTNLPPGALCTFSPASVTLDGTNSQTVTLTITTTANMALPSGAQAITVTGTASGTGGTSHTATVNLTVTATNQTFTLSSTNGATFAVAVGGTASVQVAVTGTGSPLSFVSNSMSNPTTALPLTYTCTGVPSLPTAEISCQLPNNGQPTNATAVTISLVTTPVTAQLRPLGGSRVFYALLLPGLFGIVFAAGSRTRGLRLLGLIVVLGFSTLWLGACGGSNNNSQKNPGTPPNTYTVTISATTGGANPVTNSAPPLTITLNVTAH
jgi:Pro-kumamolisin, activation domain/Bacterial Ig-like domain (group 3)